MPSIITRMQELAPEYIAIRRAIHRRPETAFEEWETTALVKGELEKWGIETLPNGDATGVVGILRGAEPGPTIALRADMDALPVVEDTGLPFASEHPGKCHACGHDVHTSTLLAAARLLAEYRDHLKGTVKFLFQPAEEVLGGAKALIARGFLDDVDAVVGAHTWPDTPGGSIGVRRGPMMAGADTFRISIRATGGHAAHPHKTADPVAAAAYVITELQTIVSREVAPLDSAVVTVGKVIAGTAPNVIPSEAVLEGSLRYFQPATRDTIHRALRRIAEGVAFSQRVHAEVEIFPGCGPVVGEDHLVECVETAVTRLLGKDRLDILPTPSMGSEDFAFYLDKAPGAFFRLGTGMEAPESHLALHSGRLLFSEDAISAGAVTFCGLVFLYTGSDFDALL